MCIIGKSWLLLLQLSNATILQILRIKCKFLSKKNNITPRAHYDNKKNRATSIAGGSSVFNAVSA